MDSPEGRLSGPSQLAPGSWESASSQHSSCGSGFPSGLPGPALPVILCCDLREGPQKQSKLMSPPCPTPFSHPGPHIQHLQPQPGLPSLRARLLLIGCWSAAPCLCLAVSASSLRGSPATWLQPLTDSREWLLPLPLSSGKLLLILSGPAQRPFFCVASPAHEGLVPYVYCYAQACLVHSGLGVWGTATGLGGNLGLS